MAQVVFRGYALGDTGYATTNMLYILGLKKLGVNVKLVEQDERYLNYLEPDKAKVLKEAIDTPFEQDFIYLNRTVLPEFKPWNGASKTFASTVWEVDPFPQGWVDLINNNSDMDQIIVPSYFNKNILEGSINKPVVVVGEGIDFSLIKPKIEHGETFNFLSVFQFLPRKGYDVLFEAFFREFTNKDNVSLIIKTSSLSYEVNPSSQILTYISSIKNKYKRTYPVYVHTRSLSYDEILNLYARSDAFVLPSRAEGFGRPFIEAMANELPIIGTNWSGQSDFLTNDNSYPLDYQLRSVEPQWYCGDFQPYMNWAEPSIEHLQYLLRQVYNNREEAKIRAKIAKQDSLNFDYIKIANDLKNALGL